MHSRFLASRHMKPKESPSVLFILVPSAGAVYQPITCTQGSVISCRIGASSYGWRLVMYENFLITVASWRVLAQASYSQETASIFDSNVSCIASANWSGTGSAHQLSDTDETPSSAIHWVKAVSQPTTSASPHIVSTVASCLLALAHRWPLLHIR